jgi:hypothetical protein
MYGNAGHYACRTAVFCFQMKSLYFYIVSNVGNKQARPYGHVALYIDAMVQHRNIHTFSEVVVKNKSIANY